MSAPDWPPLSFVASQRTRGPEEAAAANEQAIADEDKSNQQVKELMADQSSSSSFPGETFHRATRAQCSRLLVPAITASSHSKCDYARPGRYKLATER